MRQPFRVARYRYEKFGAVTWSWLFGLRTVTVQGPEAAEVVLVNKDKAFANGPAWSYFIGPVDVYATVTCAISGGRYRA